MALDYLSTPKFSSLTGTGTEMVVVDATGTPSRQAIPGGGGGTPLTRTKELFTATAGQTVFTTSATLSASLTDVYLNGSKLSSTSYTASGTTLTLGLGAFVNDNIEVVTASGGGGEGGGAAVWGTVTGTLSDQTDLNSALGLKAPLASPTFTGTVSGITKAMVGLSNVDNTADTAKPVSTAQQTALDLKAPIASPTFTGTVSGITKTMVGLSNVDNTADSAKPVSTAQQTALDAKQATLVSGTNLKTINGESLLGSTNIVIPAPYRTLVTLGANVTNSTTSYADVTGLSFTATAGVQYRFYIFVPYDSAATATGSRWAISGPAITNCNYKVDWTLTSTSQSTWFGFAYDGPAANATSLTAGNIAIIQGMIKTSATGSVRVRFASEVATSTITAIAGASLEYW